MPCVYYTDAELQRQAREALDKQTDRLCRLCKVIEANGIPGMLDMIEEAGLTEWWTKHKAEDAAQDG